MKRRINNVQDDGSHSKRIEQNRPWGMPAHAGFACDGIEGKSHCRAKSGDNPGFAHGEDAKAIGANNKVAHRVTNRSMATTVVIASFSRKTTSV